MADKTRVLFLCTGNSARSQMAEAFLRRLAGDRFEVHSAGLEPKGLNPLTIQVMEELGYDLSGHTSKHMNEYLGKTKFDHVITVCDHAAEMCPYFPGAARQLHWSFEDPAKIIGSEAERLAKFRQVRDQIQAKIKGWLQEL